MAQRSGPFYALATRRADGTAVVTPVWLGSDGISQRFCFTSARSGKVMRLLGDDRVSVAASDFHGTPRGHWVEGTARLLAGAERRRGMKALGEQYGWRIRWFRLLVALGRWRRRGGPGAVIGIVIGVEGAGLAPEGVSR